MSVQDNPDPLNKNGEPYPVDPTIKVLKGKTLFKNNKWWEAVLYVETNFDNKTYRKIIWYRWQWKMVRPKDKEPYQKWTRREHKNINFFKNWLDAKAIIDEYSKELT